MPNEPTKQDLEILAYVDGHLDESAARDLEERMRTSPNLANRIQDYRAQNKALGLAYDASLTEPVPARLLAALEMRTPDRARMLMQVVALVFLVTAASVLGWLAGRSYQPEGELTYDFVERSYNEYVGTATKPNLPSHNLKKAANAADTISVSLNIPDLSHLGYRIVDKQMVAGGSTTMVRLNYTTGDDRSFSLFLHPRRDYAGHGVELRTERSVSIAYWVVGPLAVAVAARLPPDHTLAIAQEVRDALSDPGALKPTIQTTSPQKQRDLVTGLPVQDMHKPNSVPSNPMTAPHTPNAIPN